MVSTIAFTLMLVAIVVLLIIPSFKKIRSINEQVLEERKRLELLYTRGQVQKTYGNVKEDAEFLNNILLKENQNKWFDSGVNYENILDESFNIKLTNQIVESPLKNK